jgi:hypothetical protein
MIVLALIAIGVVWGIFNKLLSGKGADIDISQRCLNIDVHAIHVESLSCVGDSCPISFKRTGNSEDKIGGVKVVLKSNLSASQVMDVPGEIPELSTVTKVVNQTSGDSFDFAVATKVEVTPYFEDSSGNKKICPRTTTYQFAS